MWPLSDGLTKPLLTPTALRAGPLRQVVQYPVDDISKLGGRATVLASEALSNVFGINVLNSQNLGGYIMVSNEVCPDTGCAC